jgi:hypothetical protein
MNITQGHAMAEVVRLAKYGNAVAIIILCAVASKTAKRCCLNNLADGEEA